MIRTKAGQSENLADHVVAEEVGNTALSVAPISPTSQPDTYSPQVGDVVDIGIYCGASGKRGIIFNPKCYPNQLAVTLGTGWNRLSGAVTGLKKIGHTSEMGIDPIEVTDAHSIAKAYFAQPKFKVGDKARYKGDAGYYTSCIAGEIVTVRKVREDEVSITRENGDYQDLHLKDLELALATFTPDPDKSYAENQAAWVEFYGLEKGSKLKATRGYSTNEGGYFGTGQDKTGVLYAFEWDQSSSGIYLQRIGDTGSTYYPYFALEPA